MEQPSAATTPIASNGRSTPITRLEYGTVAREGNTRGDGVGIGGGVGRVPEGYPSAVTFYVEVPDVEAGFG